MSKWLFPNPMEPQSLVFPIPSKISLYGLTRICLQGNEPVLVRVRQLYSELFAGDNWMTFARDMNHPTILFAMPSSGYDLSHVAQTLFALTTLAALDVKSPSAWTRLFVEDISALAGELDVKQSDKDDLKIINVIRFAYLSRRITDLTSQRAEQVDLLLAILTKQLAELKTLKARADIHGVEIGADRSLQQVEHTYATWAQLLEQLHKWTREAVELVQARRPVEAQEKWSLAYLEANPNELSGIVESNQRAITSAGLSLEVHKPQ